MNLAKALFTELDAGRHFHRQRIHLPAVGQNFIMQMGAGRPAGAADITDYLSLAYTGAEGHLAFEPAHMSIGGVKAAGMPNADILAVAALAAAIGDYAVTRCIDRRTRGCGKVDAAMHFRVTENRVAALAET